MTVKDREALLASAVAHLPDNTTGLIKPADVRELFVDMADSSFNPESDTSDDVPEGEGNRYATPAGVAAAADEISAWRAATAAGGAISFDCQSGERLCWQHTATAATFINAPVNLPDGMTCYLEFDPAGQTITWGSAYRDDPPDVTVKSLIVIVRSGAQYIATLAHEAA